MAGEIQLNGTTALTESGGAITLNNVNSETNRTNLGIGGFTGMIASFAMSSAPTGWLICNGAEYAIADYGDLHTAIGTTWGSLTNGSGGAGSTHFRVPDLRGEFLRGFDNGQGNDPDASSRTGGDAVGSSQSDAIRNITGSYRDTGGSARALYNKTFSGAFQSAGTTPRVNFDATGITGHDLAFDASNVVPTGSDNRPRNKYVQFCIKY